MGVLGYASFDNSGGDLVLGAVLAVIFAFIGYRTSHRFRTVVGVTPWRIPSIAWAAICFFLQPIGVIIEWVAEFTTRPVTVTHPDGHGLGARAGTFSGAAAPVAAPAPPAVAPPMPARYPAARDEHGHNALFGWYGDVTRRHELRYWDGKRWSEHVSDAGVVGSDPLGD